MSMPTYRVTIARSDGRYAAAEVSHEQLGDQIFMADAVDKMRASLAKIPRRTNGGSLGVEGGEPDLLTQMDIEARKRRGLPL